MPLNWTTRSKRFETEALPHLGALYRMARQLVGLEGADDIVQETFLRAWKYFETFDSASNCRAWLFRILRNAWISRWRKSRLELPLTETEAETIEPYYDWEEEFLKDELSAGLKSALSTCRPTTGWPSSSPMLKSSVIKRSGESWNLPSAQ